MAVARRQTVIIALILFPLLLLFASWNQPLGANPISLSPSTYSCSSSSSSSSSPSRHSSTFSSQTSSSHRTGPLPTVLLSSNSGFNAFANLYLRNGTLFLLSPPGSSPYDAVKGGGGGFEDRLGQGLLPLKHITSKGIDMSAGKKALEPSPEDIQVIAWEDRGILGLEDRKLFILDGLSFLFSDAGQFMTHYYHMWAELVLGAWKAITLAYDDDEDIFDSIPDPRRLMFTHTFENAWRDKPGLSGYLFKAVFPAMAYEYSADWEERRKTDRTFMFEQVVIADRSGGHLGSKCGGTPKTKAYFKIMANVFLTDLNRNWIKPIRRRLLDGMPAVPRQKLPVVTYISRQKTHRALVPEDHEDLVAALEESAERNGYILEIPVMEAMSKDEQFALAARTTVMLGVHGNGLTHQMWMEPSPWSTVIEIFINQGFFYDYALPAEALGHVHYGVWSDGEGNNTVVDSAAEHRQVNAPPGYHSPNIRVDGDTVARLIESRLKGWKASA